MVPHRIISAVLGLLLFGAAALTAQDTVTVAKVIDGLSFRTSEGTVITLLGLAAPRSKAITAADARDHLAMLIEGKDVIIHPDTLAGPDKGKKLFRYVYLGSELVNLRMLADGYAASSSKKKHSMSAAFSDAEKTARSSNAGAWATELSTAVQCTATTRKGSQCRRTTTNLNRKCWQHQ